MADSRQNKFQFADTLRGIAAGLVLLDHTLGLAGLSPTAKFPLLSLGQLGVALFFLVSGFVIPISLPKYSVPGFLVARVLRIYPTYAVAFAIAWLVAVKTGAVWSGVEVVQNFLIVRDFFGPQTLQPVAWTLEVELKFYLVCAIFVLPLRSMRAAYLFLPFALLISSAAIAEMQSGFAWQAIMISGMTIAFISIGTAVYFHMHQKITTPVLLIVSSALCLGTWIVWSISPAAQFSHLAGNYAFAAMLFLGCYFLRGMFGEHPIFAALSKISYPLYVVHLPILTLSAGSRLGVLWGVVIAFAVATAIHYAVELPCHNLGRRLAFRLNPPIRSPAIKTA
jgi:peptidoglycan/LPS O-acetylase OafA/YrhL